MLDRQKEKKEIYRSVKTFCSVCRRLRISWIFNRVSNFFLFSVCFQDSAMNFSTALS